MSLKFLTRSTLAAAAIAAATFTAGTTIGSSDAEARHRHHRHHRHLALMWAAPIVLGTGYVSSCHALKVRAEITGSAYWYERYLACMDY